MELFSQSVIILRPLIHTDKLSYKTLVLMLSMYIFKTIFKILACYLLSDIDLSIRASLENNFKRHRMFSCVLTECANRVLETFLLLGVSKAHIVLNKVKSNICSEPEHSSDRTTLAVLF